MFGDPWPDEPDEFDPVNDIGPDAPSAPETPGPDPPKPPTPDTAESEVDPELFRAFWKLVVIFNLALFALALGPMLIFFRGDWGSGLPVFVIGVSSFVYGYLRYKQHAPTG